MSKSPNEIGKSFASRVRKRCKEEKLTQEALSSKSGVSLGSLKRFERTGEISLISLIKLGKALDYENDFEKLFEKKFYRSIEEVINDQ